MNLEDFPADLFVKVMAVNVAGVFNGVAAFMGDMRIRASGRVVNTSSISGLIAYHTLAAYSASKFVVTGLSDALRG